MALSDTLLKNGFKTHILPVHGNEFRILGGVDAGKTFVANDNTLQAIDPDMPLGKDAREMVTLNVARPGPNLQPQESAQIEVEGMGERWRVIDFTDNPSDTTIDYVLQKLVRSKDYNP